ncbi:MAG: hypothetical protein ACI8P9_001497 [Parasphingorhabdus sp.]
MVINNLSLNLWSKKLKRSSFPKYLLLGVCSAFALPNLAMDLNEIKVEASLGAIDAPVIPSVGQIDTVIENGKEKTYTVVSVGEGMINWIDNVGCEYSKSSENPITTPTLKWKNCSGSEGSRTITKTKG